MSDASPHSNSESLLKGYWLNASGSKRVAKAARTITAKAAEVAAAFDSDNSLIDSPLQRISLVDSGVAGPVLCCHSYPSGTSIDDVVNFSRSNALLWEPDSKSLPNLPGTSVDTSQRPPST